MRFNFGGQDVDIEAIFFFFLRLTSPKVIDNIEDGIWLFLIIVILKVIQTYIAEELLDTTTHHETTPSHNSPTTKQQSQTRCNFWQWIKEFTTSPERLTPLTTTRQENSPELPTRGTRLGNLQTIYKRYNLARDCLVNSLPTMDPKSLTAWEVMSAKGHLHNHTKPLYTCIFQSDSLCLYLPFIGVVILVELLSYK